MCKGLSIVDNTLPMVAGGLSIIDKRRPRIVFNGRSRRRHMLGRVAGLRAAGGGCVRSVGGYVLPPDPVLSDFFSRVSTFDTWRPFLSRVPPLLQLVMLCGYRYQLLITIYLGGLLLLCWGAPPSKRRIPSLLDVLLHLTTSSPFFAA